MTSRLPADDEARRAASHLLGTKLSTVDAVPSFAGNCVFRATTPTGVVFLKFGEAGHIEAEHAVLRVVQDHRVPVPEVAAVDIDGQMTGYACLILHEVAGRPLTGGEPVFSQAGALLQRIHSIGCNGFGSLTVTHGGKLRGEQASWTNALRQRVNSATPVAAAGLVPARLIERASRAVEAIPDAVAPTAQLLHGDFHPRHVYADATGITAIIDWGDATAGDPDYDVARLLHSVMARAELATAVEITARVLPAGDDPADSGRLQRLLAYAAVFVLWSMRGEYDAGAPWPPWWPMQTAVLERILDAWDAQ